MNTGLIEVAEGLTPEFLIDRALCEVVGPACITCSFQAEDMVVLDLLRRRVPGIPVLFLDTGYHFAETYAYRGRMAAAWNLNLINLQPVASVAEQERFSGLLYLSDPTSCCGLRKVTPLMNALKDFNLWFTGLRREQSSARANLRCRGGGHRAGFFDGRAPGCGAFLCDGKADTRAIFRAHADGRRSRGPGRDLPSAHRENPALEPHRPVCDRRYADCLYPAYPAEKKELVRRSGRWPFFVVAGMAGLPHRR